MRKFRLIISVLFWISVLLTPINAAVTDVLANSRIEIPETVINPNDNNIYTVTKIEKYSFSDNTDLISILIPQTIQVIDTFAFRDCVNLQEIKFAQGSSLKNIRKGAFEYCQSIQLLELPNSVLSIEDYVFNSCNGLRNITLPANLEQLFEMTFKGLTSLENIICNSAQPPTIKASDKKGGNANVSEVFEETPIYNVELYVPDGSVSNYNKQPWNNFKSISDKLPVYNVVKINNLYYQVISDELKTVRVVNEKWPLGGYTESNLPTGNISIPKTINHPLNNENYTVTEIVKHCFNGNNMLTTIYIPSTIEQIDSFAFRECRNLKTVEFEEGNPMTRIYRSTFEYCHSLTNIVLPENIETIEDWAFLDCKGLESVTVRQKVKELYEFSFRDCSSLKEFVCLSAKPPVFKTSEPRNPIADWVFYGSQTNNTELVVSIGAKKNYTGIPWNGFKTIVEKDLYSATDMNSSSPINVIRKIGNQITLSNLENRAKIRIYTVSGQLIFSQEGTSDNVNVTLQNGIYIVSVNESKIKIFI
jgi:hypothetical protein